MSSWIFALFKIYPECIILTASGPVTFSGPFDIMPESTKDNAQIYFRGSDGFMHVAHVWMGTWVQGRVRNCPEPESNKCLKDGNIRYAGGMVAYASVQTIPMPLSIRSFAHFVKAYYYGKCDT